MTAGSAATFGEPSSHDGPHVFVDDLERPTMMEADEHHIVRVLRVRTGDSLTISDGRGGWRLARLGPEHTLEPIGPVQDVPRPAPALTLAFALVKGDRPEWIVQKATELGIDCMIPFTAERSVVRWDPRRAERHHDRLVRTSREAAMQSRRCWLPEVRAVAPFAELLRSPGVAVAERYGPPLEPTTTTVLVGPEGGWSDGELARAGSHPRVGLGGHVLRAETAAIAAATMLGAMRAGLVAPAAPAGPR